MNRCVVFVRTDENGRQVEDYLTFYKVPGNHRSSVKYVNDAVVGSTKIANEDPAHRSGPRNTVVNQIGNFIAPDRLSKVCLRGQ
jgi:hypothetical protein